MSRRRDDDEPGLAARRRATKIAQTDLVLATERARESERAAALDRPLRVER